MEDCINKGKSEAYKIKHANILLKADANGPGKTDEEIADAYNCHTRTVASVRKRFATEGLLVPLVVHNERYRPHLVNLMEKLKPG